MKAILTSHIGGFKKKDGKRIPTVLFQGNHLLENLKSIWKPNANVLIICAEPEDHEKNDSVRACYREAFPMSGLSVSNIEGCDDRNPEIIESLCDRDVIVLSGGHVPTQNRFMRQLRLKERLAGYHESVVAWSAGSMNCANLVYAAPELEGEAVDPAFERWLPGLGITDVNIFPHFQNLRDEWLDGLRVEDIVFADSMGHEIIALNDGSYLMVTEEGQTLYGEACRIRDGRMEQICRDGETLAL